MAYTSGYTSLSGAVSSSEVDLMAARIFRTDRMPGFAYAQVPHNGHNSPTHSGHAVAFETASYLPDSIPSAWSHGKFAQLPTPPLEPLCSIAPAVYRPVQGNVEYYVRMQWNFRRDRS